MIGAKHVGLCEVIILHAKIIKVLKIAVEVFASHDSILQTRDFNQRAFDLARDRASGLRQGLDEFFEELDGFTGTDEVRDKFFVVHFGVDTIRDLVHNILLRDEVLLE